MPRPPFTVPVADGPVAPWLDRTAAAIVVGVAATVTTLLFGVAPDPRGFGTHEQLGMSKCGFPIHYGFPCPTCGCTTAACLLVHGRPLAAVVAQPFGATVAVAGLLLGLHALRCLVQGRSFADLLLRLPLRRVALFAVVLLLASWGYKCAVFEG